MPGGDGNDLHWISHGPRRSQLIPIFAVAVCVASVAIVSSQDRQQVGPSTAANPEIVAKEPSASPAAVRGEDRAVPPSETDAPGKSDAHLSDESAGRRMNGDDKPVSEDASAPKRMPHYKDLRDYMLRP